MKPSEVVTAVADLATENERLSHENHRLAGLLALGWHGATCSVCATEFLVRTPKPPLEVIPPVVPPLPPGTPPGPVEDE